MVNYHDQYNTDHLAWLNSPDQQMQQQVPNKGMFSALPNTAGAGMTPPMMPGSNTQIPASPYNANSMPANHPTPISTKQVSFPTVAPTVRPPQQPNGTIPPVAQQPIAPQGNPPAQTMRYAQQSTPGTGGMLREQATGCNMPLAMAWFEYQKYGSIYSPDHAMKRGTLYPELDKPWLAPKGGR